MFFAAIGLAMGTSPRYSIDPNYSNWGDPPPSVNWFNALLGAASAAVVWGLMQQVRVIRRQATPATDELAPFRTAAHLEAALRLLLAAIIAGCMTIQLLTMRRFFELPEGKPIFYGDVVTRYLWWFGILAALTDALDRADPKPSQRRRIVLDGVLLFGLLCLATCVLIDLSGITFMVYIATSEVDGGHGLSYSRYPIMSAGDEWLLLCTGLSSVVAIVGVAVFYFRAMNACGPRGVCRPRLIAAIALALAVAGSYVFWFYATARNYYAPDLENVGFGASWWHHVGGVALAATWVTCSIYRGWHAAGERSTSSASHHNSIDLPLAAENLPGLALISLAAIIHLGQNAWHNYGKLLTQSEWEGVALLLTQPVTYFMAALLVRSVQLMRLRWKGGAPAPLVLVPITLREFVTAWLLLAGIIAVAIPTFAAFSFSFWLGPWYRW